MRLQSMTNTSTLDTEGSVEQAIRIAEAGGEIVRLTTQGSREAANMADIKKSLIERGCDVPIVADVHFNPNAAFTAAATCDKVRINPGNFVDAARTFRKLEFTDEEYAAEIDKIRKTLVPFLDICKEHSTCVRLGVNHGSLSDRIMSRYGDTPAGMVESVMEFLRICREENFDNIVISIKASNPTVMVATVRLLCEAMEREGMRFPLHLGVTEAGDGEDGRIKSAVGIGTLMSEGIGDTIRVSLSEEPEAEIPVAKHLVEYITDRAGHTVIPGSTAPQFDYLHPERRKTRAVGDIGGNNVPVVITTENGLKEGRAEASAANCGDDMRPDYIYIGHEMPESIDKKQKYIIDFNAFASLAGKGENVTENVFPIFPHNAMPFISSVNAPLKFLVLQYGVPAEEYTACLKAHPEVVVVCMSSHRNRLGEQRALVHEMTTNGVENPVVFCQMYSHSQEEKGDFQLEAAADMGALMFDGLTDGIWLMNNGTLAATDIDATAFGILQAARLRTSKTEYISCPGCGRTLYDLRSTIARIKEATKHMKGLKIGIMGCIVNGPGEMADADYGYVGAGRGRISLYRRKECVMKNIPEEEAVERLLELIRNEE